MLGFSYLNSQSHSNKFKFVSIYQTQKDSYLHHKGPALELSYFEHKLKATNSIFLQLYISVNTTFIISPKLHKESMYETNYLMVIKLLTQPSQLPLYLDKVFFIQS